LPEIADEFFGQAGPPAQPLTLWYRRPAADWKEALPVGNGRLGCMVRGGVSVERLWLNEDSLWSAGPMPAPAKKEGIAQGIREVRELMFADRLIEGEQLLWKTISAPGSHQREVFGSSELLGILDLHFSDKASVSDYRRELDLDAAIARVRYSSKGVTFTREVFSSEPDQVIVVRLEADKPGSVSFVAKLLRGTAATTNCTSRVRTRSRFWLPAAPITCPSHRLFAAILVRTSPRNRSPRRQRNLTRYCGTRILQPTGNCSAGSTSISEEPPRPHLPFRPTSA